MHSSHSHDAVIRVYDHAGNVIEMHEHKGDFKEWWPHCTFEFRAKQKAATRIRMTADCEMLLFCWGGRGFTDCC